MPRPEVRAPIPFAESEPPPAPAPVIEHAAKSGDVALAGPDGKRMRDLLRASQEEGVSTLYKLTRAALKRLLSGQAPIVASQLWTNAERQAVANALASTNATAELLGRARIRERMERAQKAKGLHRFADDAPLSMFADKIEPLPPLKALEYFRGLIPSLSLDPARWGPLQQRTAFTLAQATEGVLLDKVKGLIADRLATGKDTGTAGRDIEEMLVQAGVSPRNAQYGEMVFRTNAMDAYNVGAQQELQTPELTAMFPVFEYLGIDDERAGSDHRPKFGKYYPSRVAFAEVRGDRPFNCRCTFRPVDRYEWADLQSRGARVEERW